MYLGIDFLITPAKELYLIEVNVGLPGGAQEYHFTHTVHFGKPSDVFQRIEQRSLEVYGKSFQDHLHSLPWITSLKPFKLWMDERGPFPGRFHPGLRFEDKWNQYQLIKTHAPMPETILFDPKNLADMKRFFKGKRKVVLKRRLGRGGRGLQILTGPADLKLLSTPLKHSLFQEYIESQVNHYTLSIRSVAFAGIFMCMYANLSSRPVSNHGTLAFVQPGQTFGLSQTDFKTRTFNQKSWEAEIWFEGQEPEYLRNNLYEDVVAEVDLILPKNLFETIKTLSVKIERLYDTLNPADLPEACFEE